MYFTVGLTFAETKISSQIRDTLAFRSRKIANPDESYDFRASSEVELSQTVDLTDNLRLEAGAERHGMETSQAQEEKAEERLTPSGTVKVRLNRGKEPSASLHEAEVMQLQAGQSQYVFYCKELKKRFLSSPSETNENDEMKGVLNGVTFGIKKNEIFGLIGPNGAGKSTLINIITSQIDQDSGEFIVNCSHSAG